MLKQRVLTAVPLAVFVIWGMLTQPVENIFYALLFVLFVSAWEWAQLSGVQYKLLRVLYALTIVTNAYLLQMFIYQQPQWLEPILLVTVCAWLFVIYYMFSTGPQQIEKKISPIKLVIGFMAIIPPLLALLIIREQGVWWLFYCLSIVWVADIGAYFSGKRFGRIKLAEKLSPGKTREGLYGAVVLTAVYSILAGIYFELSLASMFFLSLITMLAAVISVAGDLSVSLLKREMKLKDTGHILPGHGGILDRIDSVLSSAPLLALLLMQVVF